ncbi:hypothetical protein AVEN_263778-1 [Araneus ventricosus]|uniref:Uncharacterized protein n=1 Tax=Araneus ventricosus TaxID=182803 RepID=A0A4Y2AS73_ARAVE|nr:hypothetical protein AVEN_263778-1 [Araneus ventricosus]
MAAKHHHNSPDLALSDFHLFGPLKKHLAGCNFRTDAKIQEAFVKWLRDLDLQFFQFKWTVNDSMAAHLSKLKNLWNELNLGLERKQEAQLPEMLLICKILDTLPQEYRSFKSSWLLLNEDKEPLMS